MMINIRGKKKKRNKNVHQLVRHLYHIDHAVQGSELFCYNTEDNRNSCRIDVTRLEQCVYIKIAILRGENARECQDRALFSIITDVYIFHYNEYIFHDLVDASYLFNCVSKSKKIKTV